MTPVERLRRAHERQDARDRKDLFVGSLSRAVLDQRRADRAAELDALVAAEV